MNPPIAPVRELIALQTETRHVAQASLEAMDRAGVAVTPENFALWFDHLAGRNPELSACLRRLEEQELAYSDDLLADLHERFFGTRREARLVQNSCTQLESAIADILHQVTELSTSSGNYSQHLSDVTSRLDQPASIERLKSLITGLMAETRAMERRASLAERSLVVSTGMIDELRGELMVAQRSALTDSLTGVRNRRGFDRELERWLVQARETEMPLSLLMIDIDHFKRFNDTYGHHVGDQVLRLAARNLSHLVKGRDLIARHGGEEFAVVLPETPLAGAAALAEQIRKSFALNELRVKSRQRTLGTITVSIGCAEADFGESGTALVERADAALYRAKSEGRNRVWAAESGRSKGRKKTVQVRRSKTEAAEPAPARGKS